MALVLVVVHRVRLRHPDHIPDFKDLRCDQPELRQLLTPEFYQLVIGTSPQIVAFVHEVFETQTLALAMTALVLHGVQALAWTGRGLVDHSIDRRGLTAQPWRHSSVLAMIERLPLGTPVYTNAADALYFLTGRRTTTVPAERGIGSGRPNPKFATEFRSMQKRIERRAGLVVYLLAFDNRDSYLPTVEDVTARIDLHVIATDDVAVAYGTHASGGG